MTIWLALFIIILIISFILAYLSMKDFQEIPKPSEFGIFLIQSPQEFKESILSLIYEDVFKNKEVITLERLFKGKKSALVITGSKRHLQKYQMSLNLLELEDFTRVDEASVSAWEVGILGDAKRPIKLENIFNDIPEFDVSEQFWWQLVLQASTTSDFKCQIRAVLLSPHEQRRKDLPEKLETLGKGELAKIFRGAPSSQILRNYKLRSIISVDPTLLNITSEEVLQLAGKTS